MDHNVVTLVCAIIGSTTAILLALWKTYAETKKAAASAGEANDAINHRHSTSPRAFDMIAHLYEANGAHSARLDELIKWRRSYSGSAWDSGEALQIWMEDHKQAHDDLVEVNQRIERRLAECSEKR